MKTSIALCLLGLSVFPNVAAAQVFPRRPRATFSPTLAAGFSWRSQNGVSVPMGGGEVGFRVGGETIAFAFSAGFYGGETPAGLGMASLQVSPMLEVGSGPLRLGLGLMLDLLNVRRVTTQGVMVGASVGFILAPSLDLYRSGRFSLFLGAKGGVELGDGVVPVVGALVGVRL